MPDFIPKYIPVISEGMIVVFNKKQKSLRIGMMNFPYSEAFEYALMLLNDDPVRLIEACAEEFYKVCRPQTIQALIVLYEQMAMREALKKLESELNSAQVLLLAEKLLLTYEVIRTVQWRVAGRFELYGITHPTKLSQGLETTAEELSALLNPEEILVRRIPKEDGVDSALSPSPLGQVGEELRRAVSSSTLPDRMYRIIPRTQSIPAGFEQVNRVSVDLPFL